VILLEPRTPHQPEKLGNVSKNEVVFTLSIFIVNENGASLSPLESIECSSFTSPCRFLVQSVVRLSQAALRFTHFFARSGNLRHICHSILRDSCGVEISSQFSNGAELEFAIAYQFREWTRKLSAKNTDALQEGAQ
jgi:hypothetical protein